jgi:20S proteasome alpha/beta subunit
MNTLHKRPFERRKRKPIVTIIVGIVSPGGIVFTSDSQTSYEPGTSHRRDTDKISELGFRSGQKILVAESGDANVGARMLEILKELLSVNDFTDHRKPIELAEEALKVLKKQMADLNGWKLGEDPSDAYWNTTDSSFLIGYYFNQIPHLYVLNVWPGYGIIQVKNYATLGCGSTVGDFILQRLNPIEMTDPEAIVSAIYTVEEVKKVDSRCGGPTKIGILLKDEEGAAIANQRTASRGLLKTTVELIAKHDERLKRKWKQILGSIVTEALKEQARKNKRKPPPPEPPKT